MELILKKDVEHLGFADDVVTVKPGYARNFLIPQGYATMATKGAMKQHEEKLKQRAYKERTIVDAAQSAANNLESLEIKLVEKVGAGGKLFGSVSNIDLAQYLKKNGIKVDKKFIQITGGTVKTAGTYDAKVRFHRDVISNFSFEVIGQQEEKPAKPKEAAPAPQAEAASEANTEEAGE